jgi:hypothetical protein
MIPNHLRRLAGGLAITALASVAAACSGSTATTAPVATATAAPSVAATAAPSVASSPSAAASVATTGRIAFQDKGFAVTLPDGWTRIDLDSQDLDALLKAAGETNPALAQTYSAQIKAMVASGLVLFAFGPDPVAGTNVNILVAPSMGVSMDLLEQASVAQVKAMASGAVTSDRVALPAGSALHLKYALASAGLPNAASVEQYVLLTDTQQYVVSVTNAKAGEAETIARSIELLD